MNRKETTWCFTKTVPFRNFLVKIGKDDDNVCRLCGEMVETANNRLFKCEERRPEDRLSDGYNIEDFESVSTNIVHLMSNLDRL